MLNETWRDQYKRMRRSHKILQMMGEPIPKPDAIDPRDVLFHFCCDAFHLRDWIKNSDDLGDDVKSSVGKLFRPATSAALAACADIANGSKHLAINSKYSKGVAAEVVRRTLTIVKSPGWGEEPRKPAYKVTAETINAGGKLFDALTLADQAVADWDAWLAAHGMHPV